MTPSDRVSDERGKSPMFRKSLKFVIAYVVLVGVPVIGLAGILRAGRSLSAPVSVEGVWKLERDASTSHAYALSCIDRLFLQNTTLSIKQSGRDLALTVSSGSKAIALGSGSSDRRSIRGAVTVSPAESGERACGSEQSIVLSATVDGEPVHRSMLSTITVEGCSSCAPLEFHAIRQSSGEPR